MKRSLFIGIGVGCFVLVVAVVVILLLMRHKPATAPASTTTFPNSTSTTSSTPGATQTTLVKGMDGKMITTNDFLTNGQTVADFENSGNYLLEGDLGYCLPGKTCTAGSEEDYNIFYNQNYNSFTISLNKEPLGEVRTEAEQSLMKILGLSQDQMCNLNYYVGTTYYVNENYDSGNLGFSFCPGATTLPQ